MFRIIRIFYSFLTKKKFWLVIFWFLLITSPVVSSLTPYFFKLFVDAIPSLDLNLLIKILIIYSFVSIVSTILHAAKFYVGDIITIDALIDTQMTVFRHIHLLDFAYHTKKSSGSLISAIKRGEGAFWNLFFAIHHRIVDVSVKFTVMLIFFAAIDIRILLFVSVSFILGILVSAFFVHSNVKFRKNLNKEEDNISGVVVDNMINFETVKLFAKERWEQKRLFNIFQNWKKAAWKFVLTFRGLDFGMGAVIISSTFAILLYSLKLAVSQEITVGDFVLIVAFIQLFFNQLFELVWGLRDIAKSYTDIEKFLGILENVTQIKDPQNPVNLKSAKGEIEFKNVSFAYEKRNR